MPDLTKPLIVDYVVTLCRAHHHAKLSFVVDLANKIADISQDVDMVRLNCSTQIVGELCADKITQLLSLCAIADCDCDIEFRS